jgi:carbon monoxide dehydrogenase subunit G
VIIENEFTVGADIDTVWRELLDMEGVASCLPGATITSTDQDNVYDGSMRLKIGPMRVEYRGRATLSEVDEANHTAVISLSAREAKGQGSAMATIRNRLESVEAGTKVSAETDLQITGPQAQFGRGVIEDVGKRVLGEFSQRLEERIAGGRDSAAAAGPAATGNGADGGTPAEAPRAQTPAPTELDVGSLVTSSPVVRRAGAGALVAALVAIALILLRRRR